jgi:hypothetical protein
VSESNRSPKATSTPTSTSTTTKLDSKYCLHCKKTLDIYKSNFYCVRGDCVMKSIPGFLKNMLLYRYIINYVFILINT